jgi:(p)ppGpp synthase/HD superfamily hydrolase
MYLFYLIFLLPVCSLNIYNNNKFNSVKNNIISLVNNNYNIQNHCNIYYESRLKSIPKIIYKTIKKKKFPNDIYGLRIIYNSSYNDNNYYAYYIKNLISNNYCTLDYNYNNYIRYPKTNNYQSIHMYILDEIILEIQIRDIYMHYTAVNGTASDYY